MTTTHTIRNRNNKMTYTATGATIEQAIIAHIESRSTCPDWAKGSHTVQVAGKTAKVQTTANGETYTVATIDIIR